MQLFLIIAAALLISAYSAPSAPKEEEITTEQQSEDYIADFLLPNSLQNVTQIVLPEEDKKILCDFLATFRIIKIELFGAIFSVNMVFMKNVENKFKKDFKEYQEKHPHKDNKTQLEEFFGVGVDPLKIYLEDSIYKQKFYQDIGIAYQKINEHFIKEAKKMKGNLSQKTVENENKFFKKLKAFEELSKKYYNDKTELINHIEEVYKYRYQCKGEE